MQLILIGCEYAGKTTLSEAISRWLVEKMGGTAGFHDHFIVPYLSHPDFDVEAEAEQVDKLIPSLLEKHTRFMIEYHFSPSFLHDDHHLLVDWFYAEAVYADLYYGYGQPDTYGDRRLGLKFWEAELSRLAPDMAVVLLTASPDVIRQRMQANPHSRSRLKEGDIETVLARYQELFDQTTLRRKFTLDTTEATAQEMIQEFLRQMEPHLSSTDRQRILTHQALKGD